MYKITSEDCHSSRDRNCSCRSIDENVQVLTDSDNQEEELTSSEMSEDEDEENNFQEG
jgi:hypothetical protein